MKRNRKARKTARRIETAYLQQIDQLADFIMGMQDACDHVSG